MDSTVAVVIPTRGRPGELARALDSVVAQTRSADEVVVVVDGPDPETSHMLAGRREQLTVVELAESGGAAAARNEGVDRAGASWIAFLDDDDSWDPRKLEAQLDHYAATSDAAALVLSTVAIWHTDAGTMAWPTRPPRSLEPVAEYLFLRTRPGEGMLATPTIMLPRHLALAVPMPAEMRRHEDYEWFLRLEDSGARFEVIMDALVTVDARSDRESLSRGTQWRESLEWAQSRRQRLGDEVFSAFVLTEVGRAAVRESRRNLIEVLRRAGTGAPRRIDVLRFLVIALVPERVRWSIGGRLRRRPA